MFGAKVMLVRFVLGLLCVLVLRGVNVALAAKAVPMESREGGRGVGQVESR